MQRKLLTTLGFAFFLMCLAGCGASKVEQSIFDHYYTAYRGYSCSTLFNHSQQTEKNLEAIQNRRIAQVVIDGLVSGLTGTRVHSSDNNWGRERELKIELRAIYQLISDKKCQVAIQ